MDNDFIKANPIFHSRFSILFNSLLMTEINNWLINYEPVVIAMDFKKA